MDFQKLYEKLERIVEIEKNYRNRKLSDIDEESDIEDYKMIVEHDSLVNSLPEIISFQELIGYHNFISGIRNSAKEDYQKFKTEFK